jgi:lysozyme
MELSAKGAAFIGRFEGFRAECYNDPAGHATIGYGHLIHHGPVTAADRRQWGRLTQRKALTLLRTDARRFEECVEQAVRVRLTQPQFDALVSFAFNVGCNAFRQSTLLRLLNQERRMSAADELLQWDKAGGRPMAGLTRRRKEERRLFKTGLYRPGPAAEQRPPVRLPFQAGPSPSFTWQEVHRGRQPFTAADRARAILHARNVEKLRAEFNELRRQHQLEPTGLNVLSWFRPRWYNELIGGATNSQHIYALATDISLQEIERLCPWPSGNRDFDSVCNRLFRTGGFGQYPGGSRHVDSRGFRARWTRF